MIPVANPHARYQAHEAAIQAAFQRVMASGSYILGGEVQQFEAAFAAYLGVRHAVGVASGTDALILALRAVGVDRGDEVITVSHTAVATVAAIVHLGAIPVFADIDPVTRCIDPAVVPDLLSARTKAIVPVHLYGQPAPMDDLLAFARAHGLKVVEDAAQAHGAAIHNRKVGGFGDAAAFSFYPTKNLGAFGDGGAVVTDDAAIATRIREARQYGWRDRYVSVFHGLNSRLDEVQAALLRVLLRHLDDENARRREIARRYAAACREAGLTSPAQVPGTTHAMHLFVVEARDREALASFLRVRGIATGLHYPVPVHRQPAYAQGYPGTDRLPETEAFYQRHLTLPMFPELTDDHVEHVCSTLRTWSMVTAA